MLLTVEISISEGLPTIAQTSELTESSDDDVPEPALLQAWANAAYLENSPAIASIRVASVDEIQQLNKQYRAKDKATNVLSFPMLFPEEISAPLNMRLLGDIVLCASVINREAKQQSKKENTHWAHMVVHGMLHLQGFDHIKNEQAEVMEQLEIKILDQLGFQNPYK
jgi:probable rRNA maturation factor